MRKTKDMDLESLTVEIWESYIYDDIRTKNSLKTSPALQHAPKEWESLGLGQLCDQLSRHEGMFNQSEDLQEVLYNVKSAIASALDEIQVPYADETNADDLGPSR